MKIVWIADFNTDDWPQGGAELTDEGLIRRGRELGHEVQWVRTNTLPLPSADLYVVANIHRTNECFLDTICRKPFVFFVHDSTVERFYKDLFTASKVNVFMSPKHKEYFNRKFWLIHIKDHILKRNKAILQPAVIDVDSFYVGEKQKGIAVYMGLIARHKGIDNVLRYVDRHPELTVLLYGKKENPNFEIKHNGVVNMGACELEHIPDILARAEHYIHLPNWVEAFGRGAIEGYLSGCNMIFNKNVGCFSYPWPWDSKEDVKDILRRAPELFWRQIEERL